MIYGSVCSGIEAATVAWKPLGWRAAFFSEIDKFPRAVLKHYYPDTPLHGDFTTIKDGDYEPIDLLVGGTPCQSFSVAGLREGMDDERGCLALEYLKLAKRLRPRWVVWENVPGVLSSGEGRDFGAFVGGLEKLGYGWAYRTLNAQYFGVPQRRRRVFVVGYLGDWRRAAAVLFERHSLQGHTPPSRKEGERVAPAVTSGPLFSRTGNERVEVEAMVTSYRYQNEVAGIVEDKVSGTLRRECSTTDERSVPALVMAHGQRDAEIRRDGSPSLTCNHEAPIVFQSKASASNSMNPSEVAPTLDTGKGDGVAVAFTQNQVGDVLTGEVSPSMGTNQNATGRNTPKVMTNMTVRRLTPRECERLQGFPDDYTLIDWRSRASRKKIEADVYKYFLHAGYSEEAARMAARHPDGPRYKALGNSMAVPVVYWIGSRIQAIDEICKETPEILQTQGLLL